MMKKYLFLLAGLLGMFASCSDGAPTPEEPAAITIDSGLITNGLVFDAAGGEKSVSFSVNKAWTLSVAATTGGSSWCSASVTNGDKGDVTVKFTAKENTSYDDRSVSVTIKAEDVSKTFTITQKCIDALLLTSSKFEVSQKGGTIDVKVKANISYQLEVSEAAKSWITPTTTRALITRSHSFSIAPSEELDKREGEIYVKSGNKIETVKVYQSGGAILLLSKDECSVSDKGETITVDIKSNIEFGVQLPDVDWIHDMASTRGASSHTLQYVVDANETYDSRTTEIIFYDKNSNLKDTLKVMQAQKDAIVLSEAEYDIPVYGYDIYLKVSSNVDFTIETSADWIKTAATRGLESKWLHFIVDENTTQVKREGTITFTYKELKQVIKVTQLGEIPYVTFTAEAPQLFSISKAVNNLEFSVNGGDWEALGTRVVPFGGEQGNLRLRGRYEWGTTTGNTISFAYETPVACKGDIRTLIDYENYTTTNTGNAYFGSLFKGCTVLTSAPELPLPYLNYYCYSEMFSGCTNLTVAPELPATSLNGHCYYKMFEGCTSLTTVPELPATKLEEYCYSNMFSGCTSLTTAPELPATDLVKWCYNNMFRGCTSLTSVPELPATNLAEYCYAGMFSGCTSLTTSPELPATNLAAECYYSMFEGCTSLTVAPELPATALAKLCYKEMFLDCTSLTSVPELSATYLSAECYSGMFSGCTSITTVPELPATNLAEYCYSDMFSGCTSLTIVPELPVINLAAGCYSGMFSGCTSITTAPELPATNLAGSCYSGMFRGCTSITTAPELPATNLAGSCYSGMFRGCTSLTTAPELPATYAIDGCYTGMFEGCTSLTTAPELPATKLEENCYYDMFNGCTSLTIAPELPATTLAFQCYYQMFQNCTNLTSAPQKLPAMTLAERCYLRMFKNCTSLISVPIELPAITLDNFCYNEMFIDCRSLTSAPKLPATTLVDNCYEYMFWNCSNLKSVTMLATDITAKNCLEHWLTNVSSAGTLYKSSELPIEDLKKKVPSGWTIKNYGE